MTAVSDARTIRPGNRIDFLFGIDPAALIFATKTTAACLLALGFAFAYNLGQPQWVVLTIFIILQPGTSGGIVGKSVARLLGTFVGVGVAFVLAGLFSQERVLFLGGLAAWSGLCTFASQRVRSWLNYASVLSGYTAAIVGIPAALAPGNTFYLASARLTEICLGIIVGTVASELILPVPMAHTLKTALGDSRRIVSRFVVALMAGDDTTAHATDVVACTISLEDLLNSAIFEDAPSRASRRQIRGVAAAQIGVLAAARPLIRPLRDQPDQRSDTISPLLSDATRGEVWAAVEAWGEGRLVAAELAARLEALLPERPLAEEEGFSQPLQFIVFTRSLVACARIWEAAVGGSKESVLPSALDPTDDIRSAVTTGLRAALAVVVSGMFWILSGWPRGATMTLLCTLAVSRAATMGRVVPLGIATVAVFAVAAVPSFFISQVLLANVSGFPMFAVVLAPVLFLFSFLMAKPRTFVVGYMAAMFFLTAAGLQNRMTYDPILFVNTTIAAFLAAGFALMLWILVAPDTPYKQRLRFVRAAGRGLAVLDGSGAALSRMAAFERVVGGAFVRFVRTSRPDHVEDQACRELELAILGAGRDLVIRPAIGLGSGDRRAVIQEAVAVLSRRFVAPDALWCVIRRLEDAMIRSEPSSCERGAGVGA